MAEIEITKSINHKTPWKCKKTHDSDVRVSFCIRKSARYDAVRRLPIIKNTNFDDWRMVMNFDRTAYGARIKKLRRAKGYTQNQLGEILCVTGTYIGKIETGLQTGSVELAVELAEILQVTTDYLLLGADPLLREKRQTLRKIILFLSEIENDYR